LDKNPTGDKGNRKRLGGGVTVKTAHRIAKKRGMRSGGEGGLYTRKKKAPKQGGTADAFRNWEEHRKSAPGSRGSHGSSRSTIVMVGALMIMVRVSAAGTV